MTGVLLRAVLPSDLPSFFAHQRDHVACHRASFTAREPPNRQAFNAHGARTFADASVVVRTVVVDAEIVGHVLSYLECGAREVSDWIG